MANIAVYPGTFDPFTNGHMDLIKRAALIFPRLIVAVSSAPHKQTMLTLAERILLAKKVLVNLHNVEVIGFDTLLLDFLASQKANVLVRGVRSALDLDYEMTLASMNNAMNANIETVFLPATSNNAFISSSMVREIANFKHDVSPFVPEHIAKAISHKTL
jgi:pantetheine-phosphate adenylyltransferase